MRLSAATALAGAAAVNAVPTISAVGSKFFTSDGDQFYIKGIAYQLTPDDPLVDTNQCSLDIALMRTIGVNTIRVYHVDPTANHDGCMNAFAAAGIYTMIDLDTFSTYILGNSPTWTESQYQAYGAVMDVFQGYDNVLGFFIGNEVINAEGQSGAAPYLKAAARDMKAYRDAKGYRDIPIGYSAADISQLRPMLQDYLTCGGNASDNVDFFGLNSYEWCGDSSYTTSGYSNLEAEAVNFPVPIFFSETGCIVPSPRLFTDQAAIFGPEMANDWSGAIIYEWIQEANLYGLIAYGDPTADFAYSGTPTPIQPDFDNLKAQWATLSPTGVKSADYNPTSVSTRACPTSMPGGWWTVDGNVPLPTLGASVTGTVSAATTMSPASTGTSSSSSGSGGSSSGSGSSSSSSGGSSSGSGGSSSGSGGSSSGSGGSSSGSSGSSTTGTASGTTTDSATTSTSSANSAGSNVMVGMSAGLAGAMLLVTLWL